METLTVLALMGNRPGSPPVAGMLGDGPEARFRMITAARRGEGR